MIVRRITGRMVGMKRMQVTGLKHNLLLDQDVVRKVALMRIHANEGGWTFPVWMIEVAYDLEGRRVGVTRQSIIKVWIADRLERHP